MGWIKQRPKSSWWSQGRYSPKWKQGVGRGLSQYSVLGNPVLAAEVGQGQRQKRERATDHWHCLAMVCLAMVTATHDALKLQCGLLLLTQDALPPAPLPPFSSTPYFITLINSIFLWHLEADLIEITRNLHKLQELVHVKKGMICWPGKKNLYRILGSLRKSAL